MAFSFVGLTPSQVAALPCAVLSALPASAVSNLSASQVGALSSSQLAALTPAAVAALRPAVIAALPSAAFASLKVGQAQALTAAQAQQLQPQQLAAMQPLVFAALSPYALNALNATQAAAIASAQIAALNGRWLNVLSTAALNAATLADITLQQFKSLTAQTINRMSVEQFDSVVAPHLAWLSAAQVAGFTAEQIGSLTFGDAQTFLPGILAAFSPRQFDALTADAISGIFFLQLYGVGATAINGLDQAQLLSLDITGLSAAAISGLSSATLNAFSSEQFGQLFPLQVRALTTAQISALSTCNLDALDPLDFGPKQIAGLPADYIEGLSVATFVKAIAPQIAAVALSAISGLTVCQIDSMTPTEVGQFTGAQFDTMNSAQQAAAIAHGPLVAYANALAGGGDLSYAGMLKLLQTAAVGGMNAFKFGELNYIAGELNVDGGIATSEYVAQIADDVITGNSANAYWNGGHAAVALGDLTATSSQAYMLALIGKWFLGSDLPSLALPSSVGYPVPSVYEAVNLPLFGPSGPTFLDVNQGNVGDCYFLASLAETAYTDPSLITNMIHENTNGTYSVCFQVDGHDDYVTVNNQLPIMQDYYRMANGSTLEFCNSHYLWAPLIEKAYAQLMAQEDVIPGTVLGVNGNSYADTAGGGGNGISVLTGQTTVWCGLAANDAPETLTSIANTINTSLGNHLDVIFSASSLTANIGNLVDNETFEVLKVDTSTDSVLLQNPWNGSGANSGKAMRFWESLHQLSQDTIGPNDSAGFYIAVAANTYS